MSLEMASDPEKRLTGAHLWVANVALLGGIVRIVGGQRADQVIE